MSRLKIYTIFIIALNAVLWSIIVPVWHFPDEQSHFGQVAFIAEKGKNPNGNDFDLTKEIYISEQLLGTERDNLGNNKFTFHPEYRIEYTDSLIGKYEASIAALSKTGAKSTFVHREASRYPPLYYIPASIIYKLFYQQDLFSRVFAVRFWSLGLFITAIFLTYKIGLLLFPKDKLIARTLAILAGFQPMMVFSNVGVNSDALGNLLFNLFLFVCLKIILSGLTKISFFSLSAISFLAIYTKPQFIIIIPSVFSLLLFIYTRDISIKHKYKLSILLVLISIIVLYLLYILRVSTLVIIDSIMADFNIGSLIKFSWEYTIPHTLKEVFPWYWGIYDWLGVTYPRIIHKIINRIVLVGILGFGYWLFKNFKEKKWRERTFQGTIFLIIINIIYFLAVSVFDWLSWYSQKYQLGIQGRYYFPLITSHMLFLLLGWQALFPDKWKLKIRGVKLMGILMILLNFYALYLIAKTYYDIFPLSTFINQISQYKPWFIKRTGVVIIWSIYITVMMKFLIEYIRYPHEKAHS